MQTHRLSQWHTASAVVLASLLLPLQVQAQGLPNINDPYGVGQVVGPGSNVYSTNPAMMNNPYSTPGAPMQGTAGFNPWNPWFNPWFNPLLINPTAGSLIGASMLLDSQGQFVVNVEYARIAREQARQARLKTTKEAFDLRKYIRENTPSFTDEQVKIAAERLENARKVATAGDILSGRALNVLLNELKKHSGKVNVTGSVRMSGDILRRLNVQTLNNTGGNLGLARDWGQNTKIQWPTALQELATEETRRTIATQAQQLVQAAQNKEQINNFILKDLRSNLNDLQDKLLAKVNEIPTGAYLDARRFLGQFQDAIRGLETNNLANQFFNFQKWASDGRTAGEIVDYMANNGLLFAPATEGDEGAYQALYSALVNEDIAVSTNLARGKQ